MPGVSTVTEPVTARLLISDAEALRSAAVKRGTTVSALIARLVSESRATLAPA